MLFPYVCSMSCDDTQSLGQFKYSKREKLLVVCMKGYQCKHFSSDRLDLFREYFLQRHAVVGRILPMDKETNLLALSPQISYDCNGRSVEFVDKASVIFPAKTSSVRSSLPGNGGLNGSGICLHPWLTTTSNQHPNEFSSNDEHLQAA